MKKLMAAVLVTMLLMMAGAAGVCEESIAELRDLKKSAEDAIESIKAPVPPETPEPGEPTPSPTPDPTVYETLQNGSRGDDVKRMQVRLAALGYLNGSADGIYGNKTAEAVRAFQKSAELPETGVADPETQRALFATPVTAAAQAVTYAPLKYDSLTPMGEQYEDVPVEFTGRVMQLLTDDTYAETAGVYTVMRVATRGICYDVVYVYGFRPDSAAVLREGATVLVRGTTRGRIIYESATGKYVDLPRVEAETIALQ